jgi:phosphopantothenoylcysteine decarboxylase/phosphopantothenate--cysteine ligase
MGYAIAAAAEKRGARVTLVSGPVNLAPLFGVETVNVESALEMADAVLEHLDESDVVIKVAAVADYRPQDPKTSKIKKKDQDPGQKSLTLSLVENPDILRLVGEKKRHQFIAGFAAETDDLEANALLKMEKKNLDMIAANLVGVEGSGFGSDYNKVKLFFRDGIVRDVPSMEKERVADALLDEISTRLRGQA